MKNKHTRVQPSINAQQQLENRVLLVLISSSSTQSGQQKLQPSQNISCSIVSEQKVEVDVVLVIARRVRKGSDRATIYY